MSEAIIHLSKLEGVEVSIEPSAFGQRSDALELASSVVQVAGETDQMLAVGAQGQIKRLLKLVESSRQAMKSPVLQLGRTIDAKAAEFTGPLEAQDRRIGKLVSTYQAEQRRLAEEAERKRLEAIRQAEQERLRLEREAEQKRQQELAAAKTAQQRKAAEERAAAERARAEQAAQQKIAQASAVPVLAPVRAEGQVVRDVWRFEVLDIRALVKVRPDLCRIEPDTTAINKELKFGAREIPGLRVWKETVATVKA